MLAPGARRAALRSNEASAAHLRGDLKSEDVADPESPIAFNKEYTLNYRGLIII